MCSRHPSSDHEATFPVTARNRCGLRGSTTESATAGRLRMLAALTRSTRTLTSSVSPSWSTHRGVTWGVPSARQRGEVAQRVALEEVEELQWDHGGHRPKVNPTRLILWRM